jgi:hypothetical protein
MGVVKVKLGVLDLYPGPGPVPPVPLGRHEASMEKSGGDPLDLVQVQEVQGAVMVMGVVGA